MKFIKTPTGEIYNFEDCKVFDDDPTNSEVFFNAENQEVLAKELFENTGILTGRREGGENTG